MAASKGVRTAPLQAPPRERNPCIELADQSPRDLPAAALFTGTDAPTAARLAEQFARLNEPLLRRFDVQLASRFDGSQVHLSFQAGNQVGAIPLLSPTTARPDFGLVVQPRFPWAGIGPLLAHMGWRVAPQPLRLPLLRRSERRVPPWVLSSMVLVRMKALLQSLARRFETATEDLAAPRGQVDWTAYSCARIPFGRLTSIPCTFPELRDDRHLLSAIRYTVERHARSLAGQRMQGGFVGTLIALAEDLLAALRGVCAVAPAPGMLQTWSRRPLLPLPFREGLQAIDWTVEDRGLAGLSELEGIPWVLPMDRFFEAWVETQFAALARRTGGRLRSGRKNETVAALHWQPGTLGSQRTLVPDLILEWPGLTLIVDAKYKRHFEDLQESHWRYTATTLQEAHRHDLLQVLAYANLARENRVISCLAYPCARPLWEDLSRRGRIVQTAEIPSAARPLSVWLTAMPMVEEAAELLAPLESQVLSLLREPHGAPYS